MTQRIHYRSNVTRYFLDTEFHDDGKTVELYSIGIVCSDGREFYAVNSEADYGRATDWLKVNVLPHLTDGPYRTHAQIRDGVREFIDGHGRPEFWGYYPAYDWLLFCQLFGRLLDLPSGWPHLCLDLKQHSIMLGNPKHPKQTGVEHHALEDARWNRELYEFLVAFDTPE